MSFAERYGYRSPKEVIQIESIDEPLRNGLWSLVKLQCWDYMRDDFLGYSSNREINVLCQRLWFSHFKLPLDELPNYWPQTVKFLRQQFFGCQWYDVYEFVEFVAQNYERGGFKDRFTKACNSLFERELSGYRFVAGKITRMTDQQEVAEVDQAIALSPDPVRNHLHRALELLSDRNAPDYRNSIKESISAVESLVAATVGSDKGTLGQLIKKLENEIGLHPALKAAFSNLYGYTSDEGGIRHALTDEEKVDFSDAKFMLVVCSAFVNFVVAKLSTAG